ncbi:hypothetical protein NL492_26800, partial [Klebsiella pneumoniae]|nr:hypothetical protein [Klebsiella pneumoniae]
PTTSSSSLSEKFRTVDPPFIRLFLCKNTNFLLQLRPPHAETEFQDENTPPFSYSFHANASSIAFTPLNEKKLLPTLQALGTKN